MSFPKGPRFEPMCIPDVPGPNSYNLPQDHLGAYKRGAFLEKANRFTELKSDVLGPSTHNKDTRSDPKPGADRVVVLQRKLEELEKVVTDERKSHRSELERLNIECSRLQRINSEQAEKLDKQKKLHDSLDSRLQGLKKTAVFDQNEIKELRGKLRMAEHERTQVSSKQAELSDLKKALTAVEARRKDDLRDRDRRVAELEKSLAMERKKREDLEARLQEMAGKSDEGVRVAQKTAEIQLAEAQEETRRHTSMYAAKQEEWTSRVEDLVAQLDAHRAMLTRVAEEYGKLATSTVSRSQYLQVKHDNVVMRIRILRLERKLTNSEGQVVELASLARGTKEENVLLVHELRNLWDELSHYQSSVKITQYDDNTESLDKLLESATTIRQGLLEHANDSLQVKEHDEYLAAECYRLLCEDLLCSYVWADRELSTQSQIVQQTMGDLATSRTERGELQQQLERLHAEYHASQAELEVASRNVKALESQFKQTDRKYTEEISSMNKALARELEAMQQLDSEVQKGKMAEEGLRTEIERLTIELTDLERYQEAYYSLADKVDDLVVRNALAEDEAERLAKFNAEILGHNNPAQRIMYVDRIRKELADTKHKLLVSTRDHEAVIADNELLRHELGMYKSVAVPPDSKPRTIITRIGRPPLVSMLNMSIKGDSDTLPKPQYAKTALDDIPGDMTLDELM